MPNTNAAENEPLAPASAATPAKTGAQQELATPEKAPSERTANGPRPWRVGIPGSGRASLPPTIM